jgi:hypothetical protein
LNRFGKGVHGSKIENNNIVNMILTDAHTNEEKKSWQTSIFTTNSFNELLNCDSNCEFNVETFMINTNTSPNEILYFNGQPIVNADWFNINSSNGIKISEKYKFKDPNVAGSTEITNNLGTEGIYGTFLLHKATTYAEIFTENKIYLEILDKQFEDTGILFCYNLNYLNKDDIVSVVYNDSIMIFEHYEKDKFDNNHDVVMTPNCDEIKVTPKKYNDSNRTNKIMKLRFINIFGSTIDKINGVIKYLKKTYPNMPFEYDKYNIIKLNKLNGDQSIHIKKIYDSTTLSGGSLNTIDYKKKYFKYKTKYKNYTQK